MTDTTKERMPENVFETGNIPGLYVKLALPLVFSMTVTLVYNLADTFFVARTNNTDLVAGVSLCVPLFTGHGYSEAFTEHMTEKVRQLKQGCEVHLTTGPDEICSDCPNLSADGHSCMLDTDHVKTKDEQLLSLQQQL